MTARTKASTDGVEPQVASQAAGEGEASNSNHAAPGNEDGGGTVKAAPEPPQEGTGTAVAASVEQEAPAPSLSGLPTPNINHSASWAAETLINLQRFQNGKGALEAELDGKEREHRAIVEEIEAKAESAIGEANRKHEAVATDLAGRIKDMNDGISMCEAALDKAEELRKIQPQ